MAFKRKRKKKPTKKQKKAGPCSLRLPHTPRPGGCSYSFSSFVAVVPETHSRSEVVTYRKQRSDQAGASAPVQASVQIPAGCASRRLRDGCRQAAAERNGGGERCWPTKKCHEGSSINILIEASQAPENPDCLLQSRGGPKPFFQHVNNRTVKLCQWGIVRVLAFPQD